MRNTSFPVNLNRDVVSKKSGVSVLTDPLWVGWPRLTEPAKQAISAAQRFWRKQGAARRYRGHPAVTRSLVEGLRAIGVPVHYNPRHVHQLSSIVVVLCNVTALRQMITLKRQGVIKKLLAGPNLMSFSDMYEGVLGDDAIDVCLAPSQLVCDLYVRDCSVLAKRCRAWPAGVDTHFWRPKQESRTEKKVILYIKTHVFPHMVGYPPPFEACRALLTQRGYDVQIIRYGEYSEVGYLRALQNATLLVGFTASESQGLAWAEAWSADVPTLIWSRDVSVCFGRSFATSTAPYLSSETGYFFADATSFVTALDTLEARQKEMRPRDWVLKHMSDALAAQAFCDLAGWVNTQPALDVS